MLHGSTRITRPPLELMLGEEVIHHSTLHFLLYFESVS